MPKFKAPKPFANSSKATEKRMELWITDLYNGWVIPWLAGRGGLSQLLYFLIFYITNPKYSVAETFIQSAAQDANRDEKNQAILFPLLFPILYLLLAQLAALIANKVMHKHSQLDLSSESLKKLLADPKTSEQNFETQLLNYLEPKCAAATQLNSNLDSIEIFINLGNHLIALDVIGRFALNSLLAFYEIGTWNKTLFNFIHYLLIIIPYNFVRFFRDKQEKAGAVFPAWEKELWGITQAEKEDIRNEVKKEIEEWQKEGNEIVSKSGKQGAMFFSAVIGDNVSNNSIAEQWRPFPISSFMKRALAKQWHTLHTCLNKKRKNSRFFEYNLGQEYQDIRFQTYIFTFKNLEVNENGIKIIADSYTLMAILQNFLLKHFPENDIVVFEDVDAKDGTTTMLAAFRTPFLSTEKLDEKLFQEYDSYIKRTLITQKLNKELKSIVDNDNLSWLYVGLNNEEYIFQLSFFDSVHPQLKSELERFGKKVEIEAQEIENENEKDIFISITLRVNHHKKLTDFDHFWKSGASAQSRVVSIPKASNMASTIPVSTTSALPRNPAFNRKNADTSASIASKTPIVNIKDEESSVVSFTLLDGKIASLNPKESEYQLVQLDSHMYGVITDISTLAPQEVQRFKAALDNGLQSATNRSGVVYDKINKVYKLKILGSNGSGDIRIQATMFKSGRDVILCFSGANIVYNYHKKIKRGHHISTTATQPTNQAKPG